MATVIANETTFAASLDSASSWARGQIENALLKGFVPADIQSNYTNAITRAEFCRLAAKWLEYKTGKNIDALLTERGLTKNQTAFTDTKDPDILAAYVLGITSGTTAPANGKPGTFTPNGAFSREQAATMLRNACRVAGMDVSNIPPSGFEDITSASNWAVDGINFCLANNVMNGTSVAPKLFAPKAAFTREQSIITFNNIINTTAIPTIYENEEIAGKTKLSGYTAEQKVQELLNNRSEIRPLERICEYKGKIYAADYVCLPGWNSIPAGVGGFLTVINDNVIFIRGYGMAGASLYSSDLYGNDEKYIDFCQYHPILAVSGKVIFTRDRPPPVGCEKNGTICGFCHLANMPSHSREYYEFRDYEDESEWLDEAGTFCYDPATNNTTRLSPNPDVFSLFSYDDTHVYYQTEDSSKMWRVRWDGTQNESVDEITLPSNIYAADDNYFYTRLRAKNDWGYYSIDTGINRYSRKTLQQDRNYSIPENLYLRVIRNERAYLCGAQGVYVIELSNGELSQLAEIPQGSHGCGGEFFVIIGNDIYFDVAEKDSILYLHKASVGGGKSERQNVQWGAYG